MRRVPIPVLGVWAAVAAGSALFPWTLAVPGMIDCGPPPPADAPLTCAAAVEAALDAVPDDGPAIREIVFQRGMCFPPDAWCRPGDPRREGYVLLFSDERARDRLVSVGGDATGQVGAAEPRRIPDSMDPRQEPTPTPPVDR